MNSFDSQADAQLRNFRAAAFNHGPKRPAAFLGGAGAALRGTPRDGAEGGGGAEDDGEMVEKWWGNGGEFGSLRVFFVFFDGISTGN